MNRELRRVLVFRTGHLGDTVVAMPAFWALRAAFPDAHVTLLSNSDIKNPHYVSARNVLPEKGLFDSWLAYPNAASKLRSVAAFVTLATKIRRGQYDGLFYLMTRGRTLCQIGRDARLFRLAGIKQIYCLDHLSRNLLPEALPVAPPIVKSEGEFLLDCLRSEGLVSETSVARRDLALSDEERSRAGNFLHLHCDGAVGMKPLVAVGPGSKWASKIWPEERFAQVVSRLVREFGAFPVVFGGPEDWELGDRLVERWKNGANAAGHLNVREAAAALEHCALYVGNDTGTMHLAAAAGVRCVAIFAAFDWPGRWYPAGDGHNVFRSRVACEGCRPAVCVNNNMCLDRVTPDEVYEACAAVLAGSKVATV